MTLVTAGLEQLLPGDPGAQHFDLLLRLQRADEIAQGVSADDVTVQAGGPPQHTGQFGRRRRRRGDHPRGLDRAVGADDDGERQSVVGAPDLEGAEQTPGGGEDLFGLPGDRQQRLPHPVRGVITHFRRHGGDHVVRDGDRSGIGDVGPALGGHPVDPRRAGHVRPVEHGAEFVGERAGEDPGVAGQRVARDVGRDRDEHVLAGPRAVLGTQLFRGPPRQLVRCRPALAVEDDDRRLTGVLVHDDPGAPVLRQTQLVGAGGHRRGPQDLQPARGEPPALEGVGAAEFGDPAVDLGHPPGVRHRLGRREADRERAATQSTPGGAPAVVTAAAPRDVGVPQGEPAPREVVDHRLRPVGEGVLGEGDRVAQRLVRRHRRARHRPHRFADRGHVRVTPVEGSGHRLLEAQVQDLTGVLVRDRDPAVRRHPRAAETVVLQRVEHGPAVTGLGNLHQVPDGTARAQVGQRRGRLRQEQGALGCADRRHQRREPAARVAGPRAPRLGVGAGRGLATQDVAPLAQEKVENDAVPLAPHEPHVPVGVPLHPVRPPGDVPGEGAERGPRIRALVEPAGRDAQAARIGRRGAVFVREPVADVGRQVDVAQRGALRVSDDLRRVPGVGPGSRSLRKRDLVDAVRRDRGAQDLLPLLRRGAVQPGEVGARGHGIGRLEPEDDPLPRLGAGPLGRHPGIVAVPREPGGVEAEPGVRKRLQHRRGVVRERRGLGHPHRIPHRLTGTGFRRQRIRHEPRTPHRGRHRVRHRP
ncbi:hypothetical protein GCM10022380_70180 [Amycolatopsis tucumanensis]|uniref:Uncharacterized protein n=1 Tax=Amycolatopsis tucumanensis TaxID=401106 RepID=A0ABP7JD80_9PSEU